MAEFTNALILASPPEKSDRVGDAQYLLTGNNVFKENFHPGPLDKEMGLQTKGAIIRCKYLLGYPQSDVDGAFGQNLYNYLLGRNKLPVTNQLRRKIREATANAAKTNKQKAVAQARADAKAGIHEYPPGSNMNKYGAWYGFNGVPWCCIAITYWLVTTGNKNWAKGSFASYVGNVVQAARSGERHLAITDNPELGDVVIYEYDEHIEFFIQWIDRPTGSFLSVGGNTAQLNTGSYNNGGEVAENVRYVNGNKHVTNFVRIGI
jgi:hypothetical protein